MIRYLLLDLDDTLLDFQRGERIALKLTLDEMGISYTEEMIDRYIVINIDCWRALERGELTRDEVLYGRFERWFAEYGITASVSAVQDRYEKLLEDQHDFIDGARELLDTLAASGKYRISIVTNGTPAVQWPRLGASGIIGYVDDVFISYDLGYPKPKAEFFDLCFERIEGFVRSEAIIVGDSLTSDVLGGINAGILTCHFNPRNHPYTTITPDYKINKLSELPALLDSIK